MSTSDETWRTVPLTAIILEILEQRGGLIKEKDLLKILKRDHGLFSDAELNKAMMSLENKGLIHVSWLTKAERRITKIDEKMNFLAVGED